MKKTFPVEICTLRGLALSHIQLDVEIHRDERICDL